MRYIILLCLAICLIGSSPAKAESPAVVINEVCWMGSSVSSADEWIELRNTTDHEIDLSGWTVLRWSTTSMVQMVTMPPGAKIASGGFFVISNYPVGEKSILGVAPDLVTTDVSLANSNLRLELRDTSQTVIDVAGTGSGLPLAGVNVPAEQRIATMERNPDAGDGSQAGNWHTATSRFQLLPTARELGTPGGVNSNGAPVVLMATDWQGIVGEVLQLDASDAVDPENDVLQYAWTIDQETFTGAVVVYRPMTAGTISGHVAVSDGFNTTTKTFQIVAQSAETRSMSTNPTGGPSSTLASPCHGVRMVELLPNPKGADTEEYIVIENMTSEPASLSSCRIQLQGSRQYTLSGTVAAGHELALRHQRFRLPNSAGVLELVTPDGVVIDRVQYPKAVEGRSWSRVGTDWGWAKPTPDGRNAPFDPIESAVLGASTTTKAVQRVRLTGIVTAQTGIVGARYAVVVSTDGVWLVRTPEKIVLPVNTTVTLIGKQTTYQGYRALAMEGTPSIGKASSPKIPEVTIGDLDEQDAFRLLSVTGTVQTVRGSSIDLEDDSGQITVTIKTASHIVRPLLRAGDRLHVSGVLLAGVTGLRLVPRMKGDLNVLSRVQPTAAPVVQAVPTSAQSVTWYWLAGGGGIGLVALWKAWKARQQASQTA